jgi:hypothetical protein
MGMAVCRVRHLTGLEGGLVDFDDRGSGDLAFHHLAGYGAIFGGTQRQAFVRQGFTVGEEGLVACLLYVGAFLGGDLRFGRERRQESEEGKGLYEIATIHGRKATPVRQVLARMSERRSDLAKTTLAAGRVDERPAMRAVNE